MRAAEIIGQTCTFYVYDGREITGRVEGVADGLIFLEGQDEIEIIGVDRIRIHRDLTKIHGTSKVR